MKRWIISAALVAVVGVGATALALSPTEPGLTEAEQEVLDDIQQHEGLDEWCQVTIPGWGGIEAYVSAEPGDEAEWDLPGGGSVVATKEYALDTETADATRSVHESEC